MTPVSNKPKPEFAALRPNTSVLPLVAVAGSRGKSTVSSMLDAMIRAAGGSVATWISSGVYVDGEHLEGELRPWSRVLLAARYGELDAVIQELEAAVVVGAGLPTRTYPVAVLTTICGNDDSCRLSMATELEERSMSAVVGAVREDGCLIANADDLSVVGSTLTASAETMLYALHRDNPVLHQHLEAGLEAVWLMDGVIVHGTRQQFHPIIGAADIPATLDGAFTFQIQNAMAAAAAGIALGIERSVIARALGAFYPARTTQPGACNILTANGARIVIDSPLQTWTVKMLARGIKHQPHRRSIIVSTCFPNLSNDDGREVGRILGGLGGVIILHKAGSQPENISAIKAGIAVNPVPPLVLVLNSETEAIERMSATIGSGDFALILTDNAQEALAQVSTLSSKP